MEITASSFHNTYDVYVRGFQTYNPENIWKSGRYITLRDRSVSYQFFPHFHPYVLQLIQRLNEGGISELQDSDPLYLPQPNTGQPLNVLPNSTRAVLAGATNATRPDGTPISLSAGTPLNLPDATPVKIAAG